MNKHEIWEYVEKLEPRFNALADQVWSTPETCYAEKKSMESHSKELENNEFTVKRNVADIPTAIIGESGSNGPIIAFLGEYDALAGLISSDLNSYCLALAWSGHVWCGVVWCRLNWSGAAWCRLVWSRVVICSRMVWSRPTSSRPASYSLTSTRLVARSFILLGGVRSK